MALQIRRGLNQERLSITLLPGEVAYVTDYKATTKLITAVADVGDTVTVTGHGWASGQQVRYRGPTGYGLTQGTLYYVKNPTTNAFQLSTASDLSSTVNITGTASGLNYPVAVGPRDADGNIIGTSVAPVWVGDGTTVGGIAAGAWTLDDLFDVEIASDSDGDGLAGDNLANEQHLEYDASTQQWYNRSNMIIPGTLLTRSNVTFGDTGNETVTFYSPTVEAPNNLSVDSGTLYVDTANNRVGIGDTSPEYKLDVAGSIRATGDITIDGQDLISSTTTFNLVNTTATTVNTGGAATAYNIGHSSGTGDTFIRNDLTANQNADILGNLTVAGNTTLGNASGDLVTVNASEVLLTASQPFITFNAPGTAADGVNPLRGIRGNVTEDDYWFVGAGATAQDNGYLEISISDNAAAGAGNDGIREAIVVRRYGGSGTAHPGNAPWGGAPVVDEMYLFNTDGYTTIPNRLGLGINPSAKLDVNGSAIVRGDNLTVEGTIQANGGSITSSQATLTINAGGQVTIDDNVTVTGNLTVNGTTTTVNSTTLTVDDKNIELGSVATPSDTTANGGGITLKGTTDKTIIWDQVTGYWTFNQNISALGGYLGSIDVGINDENGIYNPNDDLNLNAAGGDVRIKCDFVAEGELRTWDNQITFKSNLTTAPSENIDIIVERGTSANTLIRWNESTDRWTFTNDGTNYTNLLVSTDSPSFAGATLGNITVGVDTDNTITTSSGDLTIDAATNEVIIDASLRVTGDFRTDDNIFRLNFNNITGSPAMTDDVSGMAVRRGSSADAQLLWDESLDRWKQGTQGSFVLLPGQALDTTDSPSFAGVTAGNITVGVGTDNTITTTTGDLTINAAGGDTFVDSNLVAKGQLSTYDNIVVVNADVTGAPTDNGGLFVNRGSSADVGIRFNETSDRWETTVDGTNYINLPNQALDTTSDVQFDEITANSMSMVDAFYFKWSENNDRTARPNFQSTNGNQSGIRVVAPSTAAANSGLAAISLFNTSDLDNGDFITVQARTNATDPFRIVTGTYASGVQGAVGESVAFVDYTTKYASVNPAGPTDATDLITKSYLEAGTSELAQVKIDNIAVLNTATLTTSATTADQVVDSNDAATYRSAKYQVQITSGTEYQALEILLIHNGTTASITVYGDIKTGSTDLATFAADISGGNFRLLTTPTNAVTTYKVTKTLITV